MFKTKLVDFEWIGRRAECMDESCANNIFYTDCKYNGAHLFVGSPVVLLVDREFHVGLIKYFFEVPLSDPSAYIAVELFYNPNDIKDRLVQPIEFHNLEIIKKETVKLVHFPLQEIVSTCILIYGLVDESPEAILESENSSDLIYICRFVAKECDGKITLRSALFHSSGASNEKTNPLDTSNFSSVLDSKIKHELFDSNLGTLFANASKTEHQPLNMYTVANTSRECKIKIKRIADDNTDCKNESNLVSADNTIDLDTSISNDEENSSPEYNNKNLNYTIDTANNTDSSNKKPIKSSNLPVVTIVRLTPDNIEMLTKSRRKSALVARNIIESDEENVFVENVQSESKMKSKTSTKKTRKARSKQNLNQNSTLTDSKNETNSKTLVPTNDRTSHLDSFDESNNEKETPERHEQNFSLRRSSRQKKRISYTQNDNSPESTRILRPRRASCNSSDTIDTNYQTPLKKKQSLDTTVPASTKRSKRVKTTPLYDIEEDETPTTTTKRSRRRYTNNRDTSPSPTPIRPSRRLRNNSSCDLDEQQSEKPRKKPKKSSLRYEKIDLTRNTPENQLKSSDKHDATNIESLKTPKSVLKPVVGRAKRNKRRDNDEDDDSDGILSTPPKKPLKTNILGTPKSTIRLKHMTPGIEERDVAIPSICTPMQAARADLSADAIPKCMSCREAEYSDIYNYVGGRLKTKTSGCMYVSGVPGTGKTMTVCKAVHDLQTKRNIFPKFKFLKLNALALTEPRQIYVEITKILFNKTVHWEQAFNDIQIFFKSKKIQMPHVFLIDELDKLCNRKQDVIYNLLDLPFHSNTPLIVITIANTMDLPERLLTQKVNSRLGLTRVTFKPYSYKNLVQIVTDRLTNKNIFKNEALELIARKVAAVSGDARRALAICSRATEIAEEENMELISMDIINRIMDETLSSSKTKAIKSCSRAEQLILTAVSEEVDRTGNEEVPFLNMYQSLKNLCVFENIEIPSVTLCVKLCQHLGSFRLLITQHARLDINMTLMLNISSDDIYFSLKS